ncbi:MAG: hypothetical protein HKL80_07845 [Acidimicrobiales bacterium]|nr:hypothetical protein [Acidimicrobiales bacterium]
MANSSFLATFQNSHLCELTSVTSSEGEWTSSLLSNRQAAKVTSGVIDTSKAIYLIGSLGWSIDVQSSTNLSPHSVTVYGYDRSRSEMTLSQIRSNLNGAEAIGWTWIVVSKMKRQLIPIFVTVAIMGLGIFTAKPYLAAAPAKSVVKINSSLISTSNSDINSYCRNSQQYLITFPHSPFWTWVNTECHSRAAITFLLADEANGIGMMCAYAQHEISSTPSSQVSNQEKIYASACTKPWLFLHHLRM